MSNLVLLQEITFNDDILGRPLFAEGGEAGLLSNADDVLLKVEVLGVKAEQTEPELPDALSVLPMVWPVTGLQEEDDNILFAK